MADISGKVRESATDMKATIRINEKVANRIESTALHIIDC